MKCWKRLSLLGLAKTTEEIFIKEKKERVDIGQN